MEFIVDEAKVDVAFGKASSFSDDICDIGFDKVTEGIVVVNISKSETNTSNGSYHDASFGRRVRVHKKGPGFLVFRVCQEITRDNVAGVKRVVMRPVQHPRDWSELVAGFIWKHIHHFPVCKRTCPGSSLPRDNSRVQTFRKT